MSSIRVPSPAGSHGVASQQPRRSRRTRSVSSATSNTSVRLTTVIQDSFQMSPMPNRMSVLNDETDIQIPGCHSWWKRISDNSRNVTEVIEEGDNEAIVKVTNAAEEFDFEVLSQENENMSVDLPESSDCESIHSIIVPQRKIFTNQDNRPQKRSKVIINNKENLSKMQKSYFDQTNIEINVMPKKLFNQGKPKTKPVFTAALLNASANKTINKSTERPVQEVQGQVRNLFGNRPGIKRKNVFSAFLLSDSEDDIPDIQPKVFGFPKIPENQVLSKRQRRSPSQSSVHSSASNMTDAEMDEWQHLPSSTMVEHQFEVGGTPPLKKTRLSRLSKPEQAEVATSQNNSINKSKQSNTSKKTNAKVIHAEAEELNISNTRSQSLNKSKSNSNIRTNNNKSNNSKESNAKVIHKEAEDLNIIDTQSKSLNKSKNNSIIMTCNDMSNAKVIYTDTEKEFTLVNTRSQSLNKSINNSNLAKNNKSLKETSVKNSLKLVYIHDVSVNKTLSEKNMQVDNEENEKTLTEENQCNDEGDHENFTLQYEHDDEEIFSENVQEAHTYMKQNAIDENKHEDDQLQKGNERQQEEITQSLQDIVDQENQEENESDQHDVLHSSQEESEQEEIEESNQEDIDAKEDNQDIKSDANEVILENNEEPRNTPTQIEIAEPQQSKNSGGSKIMEQEQNDTDNERLFRSHRTNDCNEKQIENEIFSDNAKLQENTDSTEQLNHTHDTTGRFRKHKSVVKSPEAVLNYKSNHGESFNTPGRNTTISKSKTMIKELNIRPSLGPDRESTGLTDGTINSSAEGSGWDSHRTTRKTLRQTFGKDFTPRKSLRTLVMERSAKRQTNHDQVSDKSRCQTNFGEVADKSIQQDTFNDITSCTTKVPIANSTEYPHFDSYQEQGQIEECESDGEKNKTKKNNSDREQELVEKSDSGRQVENFKSKRQPDQINEFESVREKEQDDNYDSDEEQNIESDREEEQNEEFELGSDQEQAKEIDSNGKQDEELESDKEQEEDGEYKSTKEQEEVEESESDREQDDVDEFESDREQAQDEELESDREQEQVENESSREQEEQVESSREQEQQIEFESSREQEQVEYESSREQEQVIFESSREEQVEFELSSEEEQVEFESSREPEPLEVDDTYEESDQLRLNTLETYLQKVKQENAEMRRKMQEQVMNSLKMVRKPYNPFKMPEIPKRTMKTIKKVAKPKPKPSSFSSGMLPPEFLEDMKYKPPKRFQGKNAPWITKRLYKYLEDKLEPKYDYRARVRAEKLVEKLYHFAKDVRKCRTAPPAAVAELKHEMARLEIVKTHYEFYCFFHEFMPREIRIRVNPDILNKIPAPKRVFADILEE